MVPESIHTPRPHERSLKIPRGRGVLKAMLLKEKCEAKLEFPGGGGRVQKRKTFHGGSMIHLYFLKLHNLTPDFSSLPISQTHFHFP